MNVTAKRTEYPGLYIVTNQHGDAYEVEKYDKSTGSDYTFWVIRAHTPGKEYSNENIDSTNTLGDAKWMIGQWPPGTAAANTRSY